LFWNPIVSETLSQQVVLDGLAACGVVSKGKQQQDAPKEVGNASSLTHGVVVVCETREKRGPSVTRRALVTAAMSVTAPMCSRSLNTIQNR
jgi:hypothetical protein